MQCHPGNTAAKFTTELPSAIELNGDWEAGLAEITYPRSFCNVEDDECFVEVHEWADEFLLTLPKGYYKSVSDVISTLTSQLGRNDYAISFKYDAITLKTTMKVAPRKIVEMSPSLSHMLGFSTCSFRGDRQSDSVTTFESDLFPDSRLGSTSMYVYCDVIEPVVVGDSKVQLLRTLPFLDKPEAHQSFTNPLYVPVQKKHFDSIEVNIITDTGDPVSFTVGKSIVVLHFRRSSNPYFLLSK